MAANQIVRRIFWFINKFLMVPIFRLGLGYFMGNPFTGYIMVIRMVGRKSGKVRYAPVNYDLANGCVYCMAGFGKTSDWYRNVQSSRRVELIMPGGALAGAVDEVTEAGEYRVVVRRLLKNAGFAGFFGGFNPFTVTDDVLMDKLKGIPLLRVRPLGPASGPADPGGWLWVLMTILTILAIIVVVK